MISKIGGGRIICKAFILNACKGASYSMNTKRLSYLPTQVGRQPGPHESFFSSRHDQALPIVVFPPHFRNQNFVQNSSFNQNSSSGTLKPEEEQNRDKRKTTFIDTLFTGFENEDVFKTSVTFKKHLKDVFKTSITFKKHLKDIFKTSKTFKKHLKDVFKTSITFKTRLKDKSNETW